MEGVRKINDILEHLNVDATNPLAVLTQVGERSLDVCLGQVSQAHFRVTLSTCWPVCAPLCAGHGAQLPLWLNCRQEEVRAVHEGRGGQKRCHRRGLSALDCAHVLLQCWHV